MEQSPESRQAGVEITPEMIEVGADVILADLGMVSVWGSEGPSILATQVYSAMEAARRPSTGDRETGAEN